MAKNEKAPEKIRLSTGSHLLDILVGGGLGLGYPVGKIINLWGDKSSGKTFLTCEIIAGARHKFGSRFKWVYDDCESGFSFDTRSLYGFEIMPQETDKRTRSETVEDLYGNIRKFIESLNDDELGIYAVDSLDGLQDEAGKARGNERFKAHLDDKEFAKGSYQMTKPKFLSQEFFPPIADLAEKKNCLIIIISQERDNVDSFSFEKNTRSGGRALDFYAHTVLGLATISKLTEKGRAIGVITKCKLFKSKTPRPFREAIINLYFDYGLDNISTNIDFLFNLRTDGGQLSAKSELVVWKGRELQTKELLAYIEEQNLADAIKADLKVGVAYLKKSQIVDWFAADPERKAKFDEVFGVPMTRAELIAYIEEKGLQEELNQRVFDKWEAIEESIKTKRIPKYPGIVNE